MKSIAIFASGSGSNAEAIIHYFNEDPTHGALVKLVISNRKQAGVLNRIKPYGVASFVFSNAEIENPERLIHFLTQNHIQLIVLAGFLRAIPKELIQLYPNRIINIHPALLPNYGGKGMYGHFVHEAVIANKEKESGISIHYVTEEYDKGQIIFQASCAITENDTPDTLAQKIHELEHQHFPSTVKKVLEKI